MSDVDYPGVCLSSGAAAVGAAAAAAAVAATAAAAVAAAVADALILSERTSGVSLVIFLFHHLDSECRPCVFHDGCQ